MKALFGLLVITLLFEPGAYAANWSAPPVRVNHDYGSDFTVGDTYSEIGPVTGNVYTVYQAWVDNIVNTNILGLAKGVRTGDTYDWSGSYNTPLEVTPRGKKPQAPRIACGTYLGQEQIHVAFWDHCPTCNPNNVDEVGYTRSTDGGLTWSTPINISQAYVSNQSHYQGGNHAVAADSQGNVYIVWSSWEGHDNANQLDIWFRHYSPSTGIWEAKKKLESNPSTKSTGPCVAVGADGIVHVSYADRIAIPRGYRHTYSSDHGATWTTETIFDVRTDIYDLENPPQDLNASALAVASNGDIFFVGYVVPLYGYTGSNSLSFTKRAAAGGAWGTPYDISDGNPLANPCLEPDNNGRMHLSYLLYTRSGPYEIYYKKWSGTAWNGLTNTSKTAYWKGYWSGQVVVAPAQGLVTAVFNDTPTGKHQAYAVTYKEGAPISPPTRPAANGYNGYNMLSWINPDEPGANGTRVVFRTDRYPTTPTDGTILYDALSGANSPMSLTHSGLTNGTTYYYSFFAHDDLGNDSAPVSASATPVSPPKVNLLQNPNMDTFSGGVASGWNIYRANDPSNLANFFQDPNTLNDGTNAPAQGIDNLEAFTASNNYHAVGIYQAVSGLTPGKVYLFTGYQDVFNSSYSPAGQRYYHNFGINSSGGTSPGTPGYLFNAGSTKWLPNGTAPFNNASNGGAEQIGGMHRCTAAFVADANTITCWTGLNIRDQGNTDNPPNTVFDMDTHALLEFDIPINYTGTLTNPGFETYTNLQQGDFMPDGWVPIGGGIGQAEAYAMDIATAGGTPHGGSSDISIQNRRGVATKGIFQKISAQPGTSITFRAWAKTKTTGGQYAQIAIDPNAGTDINSASLTWVSTSSTSWTQLTTSVTAGSGGVATLFCRATDAGADSGDHHTAFFDDTSATWTPSDSTAPSDIASLVDDGAYQTSTTSLHMAWTPATDPESGIANYRYTIGSTPGSMDVSGSRLLPGNITSHTRPDSYCSDPITLSVGGTYYASMRAVNGSGGSSANQTRTDGITVVSTVKSRVGELKTVSDGTWVGLQPQPVTAAFSGYFYVEDPERNAGIRVVSPVAVTVGQMASVGGQLATVSGEHQLTAGSVTTSAPLLFIRPVIMTNKSVGGSDIGSVPGLHNLGLLVTVCGEFVSQGSGSFTIDDGSGPVKIISGVIPDQNAYLSCAGIATIDSGAVAIRTRSADDVTPQ